MSHFIGDDGKKYAIFGEGGVKRTSEESTTDPVWGSYTGQNFMKKN